MANNQGGYTRLLTGEILADNGDGTFVVDIDADGVGISIARAPTVSVGQIGTVLDLDGAQVLIGPRVGDDTYQDALRGIGSFEAWHDDANNASGLQPDGWNAFYGSATPKSVRPSDSQGVEDGVLSCVLGIAATSGQYQTQFGPGNAIIATASGQSLRVRGAYTPLNAMPGAIVAVRIYWGTSDAMAQPFASGVKVTTLVAATLTSSLATVHFDVTGTMPVGAYIYARVDVNLQQKASPTYQVGEVAFDAITATWLDPGSTDAPWADWVPTITGTTTNPNLGSTATKTGRFVRIGTMVHGNFDIRPLGTGITVGSGTYAIPLPYTARGDRDVACSFVLEDGSNLYGGFGLILAGTSEISRLRLIDPAKSGLLTNWGSAFIGVKTGEILSGSFTYEAALPAPV